MPRLTPLPGALGPIFTVQDALRSGVPYDRLQATDLVTPFRGVRIAVELQDDLVARCAGLGLRLPAGSVFSHSTAALLTGVPVPSRLETVTPVHVSVPPPRRAVDIEGVVGHRLENAEREVHRCYGLPVSAPWRIIANLAPMVSLPSLVAAMDVVLKTDRPPDALEWWTRRGRVKLRRALTLMDAAAESPAESRLRVALVEGGLPRPVVNRDVAGRADQFVARPDMLFGRSVIVEYEGDHHRTERTQWQRDLARTAALEDLGYRVIRATAADLANPAPLIQRIRRSLADNRTLGRSPSPRSPQLNG